MRSKISQFMIVFLIVIYTCLIFTNIAVDDLVNDKSYSNEITNNLLYVEIVILSIFFIEIIFNSYATGVVVIKKICSANYKYLNQIQALFSRQMAVF